MKIIYALTAACLSLQACNNQAPTVSMSAIENSAAVPLRDAEYTAVINAPAITAFDDYSFDAGVALQLLDHEYFVAATGSIPAIEPIDGAEFEGTSRDDTYSAWSTVWTIWDYSIDIGLYMNDNGYTGAVPVTSNGEDERIDWDADFYVNDEGFNLSEPDGLYSVRASD